MEVDMGMDSIVSYRRTPLLFSACCFALALLFPLNARAYFTFFEKYDWPENVPEEIEAVIQGSSLDRDRCFCYKQYLYVFPSDREISYVMPPVSAEPKYPQAIKIFAENARFQDPSHDPSTDALRIEADFLDGFSFKRFGSQQKKGSLNLVIDGRSAHIFQSLIYATLDNDGVRLDGNFWILVTTEIILCQAPHYLDFFMERLNPDWKIQNVSGDGNCGFWSAITSMINTGDLTFARQTGSGYDAGDLSKMQALRGAVYRCMQREFLETQASGHSLEEIKQHIAGGPLAGSPCPPVLWMWQEDFPYLAKATGHPVVVVAPTEDWHSIAFDVFEEDGTPVDIRDLGSLKAFFASHRRVIKMFHNGSNHYQAIIRFR